MKRINRVASVVSGLVCSGIVLALIGSLITRRIGIVVSDMPGIAVFALVTIVYLGLSRCEEVRAHVRVEGLISRFPPEVERGMSIGIYGLAIFFVAVLTWATGFEALRAWETAEETIGIVPLPTGPVKSIVSLGCGLYLVQLVLNFITLIRRTPEVVEQVTTHDA